MNQSRRDEDLKTTIAKAYVREMLDLNPMWQSPEIMRRRREIWTGESPVVVASKSGGRSPFVASASDPQAEHRRRVRARRCLDTLETEFYQLPDDKLNQYLRFLQSDRLPEFAAKASHLRRVATQRKTLLDVREETGDEKFTYSLLTSLIGPASQAGALREQYIEAIIAERRVGPACQMVKDFVERHPEIYQLERDWFNLLLDPANCNQWSSKYSLRARYHRFVRDQRLGLGLVVFTVVFVISVTAGLFRDPQGNSNRNGRGAVGRSFIGVGSSRINGVGDSPQTMEEVLKQSAGPDYTPPTIMPKSLSRSYSPSSPTFTPPASFPTSIVPPGWSDPSGQMGSLDQPDVSGRSSQNRPTPLSSDDWMRKIHEDQERTLESHRSMLNEIQGMRPTTRFPSNRPPQYDPMELFNDVRPPDLTTPPLTQPNLDPYRYRNPAIRLGRPGLSPGLPQGTAPRRMPGQVPGRVPGGFPVPDGFHGAGGFP